MKLRTLCPCLAVAISLCASAAGATTFTVTNTSDDGPGSLRDALTQANAAGDETIDLTHVTGTITLESALPNVTGTLVVTGPGAATLTIARDSTAPEFRLFDVTGALTMSGLTLTGGASTGIEGGGAIYGEGTGPVVLSNCALTGNSAPSGAGGAILSGVAVTLTDCSLTGNSAEDGGGAIYIGGSGSLTTTRVTISGNSAPDAGAASVSSGHLVDSTFSGNTSANGAIDVSGQLTIENCTFTGNDASSTGHGAAGAISTRSQSSVDISNSTFANDTNAAASEIGGAGTVHLEHVTLASAAAVPLIHMESQFPLPGGGAITLADTIVAGAGTTCVLDSGATVTSAGHNVASDTSCGLTDETDQQGVDPMLAPLADNGGPTETMALLPGSPAIGHGSTIETPENDQRGEPRPVGRPTDVGAFQTQLAPPVITTPPASQEIFATQPLTLSVTATGEALTYLWRHNGTPIDQATASTYSVASATPADAGSYDVVVSNAAGSVTSAAATVTVDGGPAIEVVSGDRTITVGDPLTLGVWASGQQLTYAWTRDGTPIDGATEATYSVATAKLTDAGRYAVVVTNGAGSVTSGDVVVSVRCATGTTLANGACVAPVKAKGGCSTSEAGWLALLVVLALWRRREARVA